MGFDTKSMLLTFIGVLQLCCLTVVCAETTLVIERVRTPGQAPTTPTVKADGKYDVPAGSTISVKCAISGTQAELTYPTHIYAEKARFDGGRVAKAAGQDNVWTLSSVKAYDTGALNCANSSSHSHGSIYIFVNDATQLYLRLKTDIVYIPRGGYAPCLPTHSATLVTLTVHEQRVDGQRFDNTKGVRLRYSPGQFPFMCKFEHDGRSSSITLHIHEGRARESFPLPKVLPRGGKSLYLAGERLTIDCNVVEKVASMPWTYPAQNCTTQPAADCQVAGTRVRYTGPTKNDDRVKGEVFSVLTVSSLYRSDSGNYTCSYKPLVQPEFTIGMFTEITVYPRPFVIGNVGESNPAGMADGWVALTAKLESMPEPVVRWKHNSQLLNAADRKYTISLIARVMGGKDYTATLTIKSLTVEDVGKYTMSASVTGDDYVQVFNVDVHINPELLVMYSYGQEKKQLTKTSPTIYFQPNRKLELECSAPKGRPSPTLAWHWQVCDHLRNCDVDNLAWTPLPTTLVAPSAKMLNSPYYPAPTQDRLNLRLTTQRSGWLKCTASNPVGGDSLQFRLGVSVLPRISEGLGFAEGTVKAAEDLVEGGNFSLSCYIERFLCPDDEVEIVRTGGGKTRVYQKSTVGVDWDVVFDSYVLGIKLVDLTIAAYNKHAFACRCRSGRLGLVARFTVRKFIEAKWKERASGEFNVTQSATKSFLCIPEGRPLPKVTWYKDNKILEPTNTVLISKDTYNLTVDKAGVEDSGSYSCVGRTPRGVIRSNFTLTVTKPVGGLAAGQVTMIVVIVLVVIVIAIIVTVCVVRRYCRKKYTPHMLLLPSKDMINPDIPLDEQTDALPYDIGWEFPIGSLKLGMLLGQGAFGRVLKAEAMNIEEGVSSTTVAVKTVRDHHDIEQVKALISELKILIHIGQHLNIVNILGACTKDISKGHILVIVEFCRYGNLRSYLLKHKANFNPTMDAPSAESSKGVKLGQVSVDLGDDEYINEGTSELHSVDNPVTLRDIMSWCYQMARGMEYLASIDYIHRDLAARNVLLADDNIVKICDFGLAKDIYKYQEYQKQTDGPLPIKWMALESLTHKVFNVRTDVWAYGVTIWELFSLAATPYPGWDIDDTFIEKLQDGFRMELPKHCPEEIYQQVMLNCWHPDPEKRPNFAELADTMVECVDSAIIERLKSLEDPYLRTRDSRTDITIRPSSVRRRDLRDLDSGYLPVSSLQKANGARPKAPAHNYYNTSPTGSEPPNKRSQKSWLRESASNDEKLPLQVNVDDDDVDMPDMPAPSPSPWERQSHLGKRAAKADDSHSFHSIDSDGTRPPSYHYVMKKGVPHQGSAGALASPARASALSAGASASPSGYLSRSRAGGSKDPLDNTTSDKSYIETTC